MRTFNKMMLRPEMMISRNIMRRKRRKRRNKGRRGRKGRRTSRKKAKVKKVGKRKLATQSRNILPTEPKISAPTISGILITASSHFFLSSIKRFLSSHGKVKFRRKKSLKIKRNWMCIKPYDTSIPYSHRYGSTYANFTSNEMMAIWQAYRTSKGRAE